MINLREKTKRKEKFQRIVDLMRRMNKKKGHRCMLRFYDKESIRVRKEKEKEKRRTLVLLEIKKKNFKKNRIEQS